MVREDGLIVDHVGANMQEIAHVPKETRLMRALNEVRQLGAKSLDAGQRAALTPKIEAIFKKWGLDKEDYGL